MTNNGELTFNARLIRLGVITLSVGVIADFVPAVYVWLFHGVIPPLKDILTIWLVAATAFGTAWVVQPVTFFSVLGTSGSYIAWIAGSVADIRTPAVTMAQKVAGVEPGTPEGDVISTIGIAGSVFVSVTVITVFTLLGGGVVGMLPAFVKKSFGVILPAIFGAVYVELARKHLKIGAGTILLGIALTFLAEKMKVPGWVLTIVVVAAGILVARIVYSREAKAQPV